LTTPVIVRIAIFPIKSLDPLEVHEARFTPWGRLEWDREYALFDQKGRFVNGKREPRLHRIRASYNLDKREVRLSACGMEETVFNLDKEGEEVARWISRFLGYPVELKRDSEKGFPDDMDASGPTVVSTGTLVEVSSWYPGMTLGEAPLRFRTNLEIGVLEPFWEEKLLSQDRPLRIRIGEGAVLEPRGVSRRCAVPSRDPYTGAVTKGFQKTFVEKRRTRPPPKHGGNLYRMVLNTVLVKGGGLRVRIFDPVEILPPGEDD